MVSFELLQDVRKYVQENYAAPVSPCGAAAPMVMQEASIHEAPKANKHPFKRLAKSAMDVNAEAGFGGGIPSGLAEKLMEKDESFSQFVIRKIDQLGMTDAECYTKACLTRQVFNKLKNTKGYRPGKPTAVAIGFALGLDRNEFDEMLRKAGYSLSKSSEFDLIAEYCIEHGIYSISDINELLFSFDQPLLGSA